MTFSKTDYFVSKIIHPRELPALERNGKIMAQSLYGEIVMVSFRSYGSDVVMENGVRPNLCDMSCVRSSMEADLLGSIHGDKVSLFDVISVDGKKSRTMWMARYETLLRIVKRLNEIELSAYEIAPVIKSGIFGEYIRAIKHGGRGLIIRTFSSSKAMICMEAMNGSVEKEVQQESQKREVEKGKNSFEAKS